MHEPFTNMHEPLASLHDFFVTIHEPFANLREPLANMHNTFATLHEPFANLHESFAILHEPLASLHKPLASMHETFSTLHEPFATLHEPFASLRETFASLRETFASLQEFAALRGLVYISALMLQLKSIITISVTLFAVVDIIGSLPVIISVKRKVPNFNPWLVTIASGALMIFFLLAGEEFLSFMGVDVRSFALAGSIVLFVLAMEMILGIHLFRTNEDDHRSGNYVPVAFPLIAGSGTLTTILSLRAVYSVPEILIGIVINLAVVLLVLLSTNWIEEKLGSTTLSAIKKFFGVILLAISIKIFSTYIKF